MKKRTADRIYPNRPHNIMKYSLLIATLLFASQAIAQDYSNVQTVLPSDIPETIVAKAAHVVPTARQLAHLDNEFIGFIHFGPNTFTGREWGNGMESPKIFAPGTVDTDNWCQHMKAAGMTLVIMTFKHHDGYVLWQSRYEDQQTIKNSPYQNGQGDIAKQLSKSCEKYGLKFGVYISPADLYQIESKVGLYGNGSQYQESSIPTDPASFKDKPTKVRKDKPVDAPVFTYECDDYNRYMLNQLYELLTDYGPVHEVWFDGAHPKRKGGQTYTYAAWYELIRTLAPDAVIFGKGPDIRWCGNEAGGTRSSEWNVIPLNVHPKTNSWNDNAPQDIGSRKKLAAAKFLYYRPAEVNTSIRHGWFWRNDTNQSVRSADDVFDIYERAVGGNAVFLLNVPPNRDGKFSPRDADCLIEVGKRIRQTYGTDLAKGTKVSVPNLQDGDSATFWEPNTLTGEITVTMRKPKTINRFVIKEAIAKRGERIEKHTLDALIEGKWQEVATGTNVGHKRILRFPAVTTTKLRLRILESRLNPSVAEISAHFYKQPPLPVEAQRSLIGTVALSLKETAFHGKGAGFTTKSLEIRYTTDDSEPSRSSALYSTAIPMVNGGVIHARSYSSAAEGAVATFQFGPSKKDWQATATSEENATYDATKAIDGNPATYWHSSWSDKKAVHPHTLTIDLGKKHLLTGITYPGRIDESPTV